MDKKVNFSRQFELEVQAFLEDKLRFEDVKGGPNFHIAEPGKYNQTDVCGRFGDTLFVFQCTAAGRKTKKYMREKILATVERSRIALKNYQSIPEYRKCRKVVFIFITKKIDMPLEHKNLLFSSKPRIYYADEVLLEYYTDLHDKIGTYAVYDFLADFDVTPDDVTPGKDKGVIVFALKQKLGKYDTYGFFVKPKHLIKYSYVARRRSNTDNFYQRMLDRSRINKIAVFLNNGGIFPTNVILSLKKRNVEFKPIKVPTSMKDVQIGGLFIRGSYNACRIIDGQHRLYSFVKSSSHQMIPVIAFENIREDEERKFFLEINREQRPIQPDLIWDLEGEANRDTIRGIISNTVRALDEIPVFKDKIYIPVKGSKKGKTINMAAFCNGIYNARLASEITPNMLGKKNPLYDKDCEKMTSNLISALKNYFSGLDEKVKDPAHRFIFGNAGIPIMLYLYEPILAHVGSNPSPSKILKYVEAIGQYFKEHYSDVKNIKKLREETNSEGARKNVARHIGQYIQAELRDNTFWQNMEVNQVFDDIKSLERRIGSFIAKQLSDITTNWTRERIPSNISQLVSKKAKDGGLPFEYYLGLGDEQEIILSRNNWNEVFKKILVKRGGFRNENDVRNAFEILREVRVKDAHSRPDHLSKETMTHCHAYLNTFNYVIPETVENEDSNEE